MARKSLKVSSRIKTRWLLTLFILIWTVMCMIMTGILTYAFLTSPVRIEGFLIFVLVTLIVAAFAASNYIFWQIKGKETLLINEEKIVFKNENTLFKNKFDLDLALIDNVRINNNSTPKFWGVFGGKIIIEYLGRDKKFGKDISIEEANDIAIKIRNQINIKADPHSDSHHENRWN